MAAINVFKTADAVHLITDGIVTDGVGFGLLPIVMPVPHLKSAIATLGPARLLGLMTMLLCVQCRSFDDVVGELHRLREICDSMVEPWHRETLAKPFDVVVVGIGSAGPSAFVVSNHERNGLTPWKVVQVSCLAIPKVDQALFDRTFSSRNPLARMPFLLAEQQRLHPKAIGGFFCQTTTVAANGISLTTFELPQDDVSSSEARGQAGQTRH